MYSETEKNESNPHAIHGQNWKWEKMLKFFFFLPFVVSLFLKKCFLQLYFCMYSVICCLCSCTWKKMPQLLYIHRLIAGKNRKNEKYPFVLVCISASWKGLIRISFLFSLVWLFLKFRKNKNPDWELRASLLNARRHMTIEEKISRNIFSNFSSFSQCCWCCESLLLRFSFWNRIQNTLYYLLIYSDCRMMGTRRDKKKRNIPPLYTNKCNKPKKCIQTTDNSNFIYEKHHFELILTLAASLHSHRTKRIA